MKYTKGIAGIVIACFYFSCANSSADKSTDTGPVPSLPVTTPTGKVSLSGDTTKQPVIGIPVTTATPVTTAKTSQGLNPAHGMPGHRCDIAVGAPLDSKPSSPVTSITPTPITTSATPAPVTPITINPTTPSSTTVAPAIPTSTAKGMNPAHGQPGHRCDIAVGAPLDSKPNVQTANVPAQPPMVASNQIKPIPVVTPVTPASPVAPVKTEAVVTAPGMNPEHGQPGHRCDIAVGAPLNSKPEPPKKEKQ